MKKIKISSEITYFLAIALLSLAVAILSAADFGISMIVAPAYLLSLKTGVFSFGQAEYAIQAGVFIVLCLVLRRFKLVYLSSFITCLVYGAALDLWRLIPFFNPAVTAPGSMATPLRVAMYISGVLLTSFSVALFFKSYLYPQVYDFFVKAVSARYKVKLSALKTGVDLSMLATSVIMSLCFFKKFVGIGWGTLIMAPIDGTLIGRFSRFLDKTSIFRRGFKNSPRCLRWKKAPPRRLVQTPALRRFPGNMTEINDVSFAKKDFPHDLHAGNLFSNI